MYLDRKQNQSMTNLQAFAKARTLYDREAVLEFLHAQDITSTPSVIVPFWRKPTKKQSRGK